MKAKLKEAAERGDVDMLWDLIREDPNLLENFNGFVNTPLHVAASMGKIVFGLEVMMLKPCFSAKQNPDGFTPMHLAIRNGHARMAELMFDGNDNLIRIPGRGGVTPLHHVVEKGDIHLLKKFLSPNPQSIEDVTVGGDSVLHIALKNSEIEVFRFLVIRLKTAIHKDAHIQEKKILNWKDGEGNTVLHIAAANNQPKVVEFLINCGVEVNCKNFAGMTALDIVESEVHVDHKEVSEILQAAFYRRTTTPFVLAVGSVVKTISYGYVALTLSLVLLIVAYLTIQWF
ncbi:ankyrin repeat-containing protein BDA1 isoform X1 [Ziziphus jujuba]|uniref:Ankyrin repeat-containing protein BDA1 isoform X1 n=2 Tax=Ziziphus jujuba TaxID=326968 RepID=A0A6P3ZMZ8_ZIZJJ|nr:ankyrin repeat-containing protein BDA1 isoform X1 [Ziziphus jujuba]